MRAQLNSVNPTGFGAGGRRVAGTLVLFLLGVVLCLASHQVAAKDITARQLVDHLWVSAGELGVQTLKIELESFTLQGDASAGPANLIPAFKELVYFKRPNKLHLDTVCQITGDVLYGKRLVSLRDGSRYWVFMVPYRFPVRVGRDTQDSPKWLPFHIYGASTDTDKSYEWIGLEKFGGASCDVVRITDAHKKKFTTVWIDRKRWVALAVMIMSDDKQPVLRFEYKDVRQLPDGRYFPFLVETYQDSVLTGVAKYTSVSVNEELAESLFVPSWWPVATPP